MVPESLVRMASSAARRAITDIRYWGWMGSRSGLSSAAMSPAHFFLPFWALPRVRRPEHLLTRTQCSHSSKDDHVRPCVEHTSRLLQVLPLGHDTGRAVDGCGGGRTGGA